MKKIVLLILCLSLVVIGCQHAKDDKEKNEIDLVDLNQDKVSRMEGDDKIVVTSVALSQMMAALDISLAGVPYTYSTEFPSEYQDIKQVGLAMNPNMEIISQIEPTIIYSPLNLKNWNEKGYQKAGLDYEFVNLSSVDLMYQQIEAIAHRFHKEEKAKVLIDEYHEFLREYQNKDREEKKVLILMGLPGSYMVATQNSYIGSLLQMSKATNVVDYTGNEEFIQVNPETLLKLEPDFILRASHAMPEDVKEMFAKEFETNSIWKHFKAVEEGKVYDLDPQQFGMSANFHYKEALLELDKILYEK